MRARSSGNSCSAIMTATAGRYSIPASVMAQSLPCISYKTPWRRHGTFWSRRLYATASWIAARS